MTRIKYRKLNRNEIIKKGDRHSLHNGKLQTIKNKETFGQTPAEFSIDRDFYRRVILVSKKS